MLARSTERPARGVAVGRLPAATLALCGATACGSVGGTDAAPAASARIAVGLAAAPSAARSSVADTVAPRSADVTFEIVDAAGEAPIPGKLTFVGIHGTRDPVFAEGDVPATIESGVAAYARVFSASGRGALKVRHGTYDVYVTRGPEWTQSVSRGVRVSEAGVTIRARLAHVVDTPGWISGDFHVHAAPSYDSDVPLEARVYEFVSEGVEVIVSTDHNVVADYAPVIAKLGLSSLLASASGSEVTTIDWGHFGAFPLDPGRRWPLHAARLSNRPPSRLFPEIRAQSPRGVIDVHHPRLGKMGYFDFGRFDPASGRFGKPGASLDFDAVEVLNGFQDADRKTLDTVLRDWFGLLRSGRRVTATGNSDTHHLYHNLAGYPRNYVRVDDDRPEAVTSTVIADAVRKGSVIFSTGPFVKLDLEGEQIAGTARARDGVVHGRLEVLAAPWVSVDEVRLYVGGEVQQDWAVAPSTEISRLRQDFKLSVGADTFVVARVDGKEPLSPSVGEGSWFRVLPLAVTNPIYVDADGDGRCTLAAPARRPDARRASGPSRAP